MKPLFCAALAAIVSAASLAQTSMLSAPFTLEPSIPARIETMPRELPRARGPELTHALQLAQAALQACAAQGLPVSVRVADSVGVTVVLLSGDGAGERSQWMTTVAAVEAASYRMPASALSQKSKEDSKLAKDLFKSQGIAAARGGSVLLMSGSTLVGVLAVSGAPGLDETCASSALAKYPVPSHGNAPAVVPIQFPSR